MRPSLRAAIALAAACLPRASAQSESAPAALDLRETLRLARDQSPALQAERLRVDEAAGLLSEAGLPFGYDPQLDLSFGNREPENGDDGTHDWSVGIGQRFEPSGRRDARLAVARLDVDATRAAAGEAERRVLAQAAALHLRAAHAGARRRALDEDRDLARQEADAVQRGAQAGAASDLDARLAALSAGRAAADAAAAAAAQARLLAELGSLLGLEQAASVTDALDWPWPVDLEAALAAAERRPELQRLAAEVARAGVQAELAASAREPDVEARLDYGRDDRDRVLTLGLTLGLPLSGRGAGERAAAAARASRLSGELAAERRAAEREVLAAFAAHAALADAAALEGDVAHDLDEGARLVAERREAGDLGLLDLLAVRRELLATRLAWLDRRLDLALAALDIDGRSGRLLEIAP